MVRFGERELTVIFSFDGEDVVDVDYVDYH